MWKRLLAFFNQLRSAVLLPCRHKLKWNLLLILLSTSIPFLGWRHWLLTVPKPLPQLSAVAGDGSNIFQDGTYYEVSVPPTGSAQYLSADYRLWIPKGVKNLRGLIVRQHRCDYDSPREMTIGLNYANDLQWQALALKYQFALLGTKLPIDYQSKNRYSDDPCNSWSLINRGSEKAFLIALQKFSQKSQHPELVKIPWVLWGYSGGADWSIQMAKKYPERTIAVVLARGGAVNISDSVPSLMLASKISPRLLKVPILFAVGEKDSQHIEEGIELPKKVFERYRKAGAIWAIAEEPDTGHETADTRLLAIPFLDAMLRERLRVRDGKLNPVDATQGWLGNLTTHAIVPLKEYKGDPLEAVWLPNEETARKWKSYVTPLTLWEQVRYKLCSSKKLGVLVGAPYLNESCRPNKISPTQKPNAPTDVRAKRTGEAAIALTWKFTPDLENGLPPFRIYRDNSLIATLQGQGYDGGDVPVPPNVVLEFRDKKATANSTYSVSAFNELGESVSQSTQIQ
jgi:hypothetical protein